MIKMNFMSQIEANINQQATVDVEYIGADNLIESMQ